jgi:hypothetical protein
MRLPIARRCDRLADEGDISRQAASARTAATAAPVPLTIVNWACKGNEPGAPIGVRLNVEQPSELTGRQRWRPRAGVNDGGSVPS